MSRLILLLHVLAILLLVENINTFTFQGVEILLKVVNKKRYLIVNQHAENHVAS